MGIAWYLWLLATLAAWTVLSFVVGLLLGPLLGSASRHDAAIGTAGRQPGPPSRRPRIVPRAAAR